MKFAKLLDNISNIIEKNANKNYQFVMLRYLLITGSSSKKDIAIELQNYNQDVKKDYRSAGDVFKVLTEPTKDMVTEEHQMFSINNFDELSDEQRYSLINKCNEKILMIKKIKNSGSTPTNLDMTWKNAAFKVLKEENKSLHRVKITDLILKRHYVKEHNALTPYETVARDMDKDIESSNESLFKKIEPGIYGLNDSNFELDENNDLLLMGHKLFLMEIKQRKSKEEFRDFNHTDFIEDEVKYKINSLENSLKLLSINEWDGWKSTPEKICLSVRNAVAQKISSSLIWSPPYKTEIGYFDELDDALKKDLGIQLYEFFKGKNPIEQRFDHFILFLKKIDRVPEIRLLAYLMFLYNPEKYFPIHPSKFNKLLEFHNIPKIEEVSWKKYSQYVELASKIKSFLVKLNLGNNLSAIQVQSYMWIIAGEVSKKFWMVRAGKDGKDWDNQKNAGIIGIHYETIDLSKFRRTKNRSNELTKIELGTEIRKIKRTRGEDIKKKEIDSIVGQFRHFFSINRNKYGTKIIAIGNNSTVLGIGNANGEYEFRTDISKYCHTIAVKWTDTQNRKIPTITNFNLSVKEIDVKEYLKIIKEDLTNEKEESDAMTEHSRTIDILKRKKNIILYGPPGTGKTYTAKKIAKKLIDANIPDTALCFTTDYGIDKIKRFQEFLKNHDKLLWGMGQSPTQIDESSFPIKGFIYYKSEIIALAHIIQITKDDNTTEDDLKLRPERETYSKDYSSYLHIDKLELCKPFPHTELNLIDKTKTIPPTVQKFCYVEDFSKFINIVTFHQSYGYEEFIEGIRPEVKNKVLSYPIKKGIFQKICNQARNSKDNHVLIIDEINRGNISKIFGELITIIENDKRGDEVTLAYSDDPFSVPDNVYVIGTMNTADQSLTHIDAALKRRFSSIEVMPNSLILKKGMKGLPELLDKINEKVREKISRDNQIGHSYFMQDGKPITEIRDLQFVFATDIIPLLRDYFYDSDDDLKEVLGEQFIDWNEGSDRNVEEDWQNNPEIFRTAIEKAYDVKI